MFLDQNNIVGPKFCLLLTSLKVIPCNRSSTSPQPESFPGFYRSASPGQKPIITDNFKKIHLEICMQIIQVLQQNPLPADSFKASLDRMTLLEGVPS